MGNYGEQRSTSKNPALCKKNIISVPAKLIILDRIFVGKF
jgi:hypothetical protein